MGPADRRLDLLAARRSQLTDHFSVDGRVRHEVARRHRYRQVELSEQRADFVRGIERQALEMRWLTRSRPEERRRGQACGSACRSGGGPYNSKQNETQQQQLKGK